MPTKAIKHHLQERYIKWAIFSLLVFGLLGVSVRVLFPEHLTLAQGDTVWVLTIEAQIENAKRGERFSIAPPWNSPQVHVVSQKIQHTGMRQVREKSDPEQKRNTVLQVTSSGDLTLSAEYNLHLSKTPQSGFIPVTKPLDPDKRAHYLSSETEIDLNSPDIIRTLKKLSDGVSSNDEIIQRIFHYTKNKILKISHDSEDDAEVALRTHRATSLGRTRAMIGLCRAAGIPARIVAGFVLEDAFDPTPHYWLEIYADNGWVSYDPENGYEKNLPENFVAFNRGGHAIVNSNYPDKASINYELEQNYDLADLNIITEKHAKDIFNLNRFSPDTRNNLGLLLLLPFGALITALCRNLIGIRGYGTFTPTLLALAAVYADWVAGVVLLIIVIALGLSGRSAMPDKLLRVPRMATMFTIVIMSMVLGVSVMDHFQINPGEHLVLLPIVILTSLIDRFYSAADTDGIRIAIRRLLWTIIISIICYPVIKQHELGRLLLTYPEAHFITLASILTLSIYSGKRLADLPGFAWIKEPDRRKVKRKENDDEAVD